MIRSGRGLFFRFRYQLGTRHAHHVEENEDPLLPRLGHSCARLPASVADGRLPAVAVHVVFGKGRLLWMAPGYDSPDHIFGQRAITYDCIFLPQNGYEAIRRATPGWAMSRFIRRKPS